MRLLLVVTVILSLNYTANAQNEPISMEPSMTEVWNPEVTVISSGDKVGEAPSDAIFLIGGDKKLSDEWTKIDGNLPEWEYNDGIATVKPYGGKIKTKRKFGDCQIHVEWRTPAEVVGDGQDRGNCGIFLQGNYELQILDSYNNRTYKNGQAGSIYKQYPPLVNASKAPGEWQVYDIIYRAPRFMDNGTYLTPPRITVLHNGIVVQDAVNLRGPTLNRGIPENAIKPHGDEPIILQDHKNPVSFRNFWIREI